MKTKEYRIEGLSCPNCSKKFEKNVANIAGISEASVNFAVGKITVTGKASIEEIEAAGAFENLKIIDESQREVSHEKTSKVKENWTLTLALMFIVGALISQSINGEQAYLTIGLFLSAIVIGGFSLFIEGIKDLFKLNFSMQLLMTIAIIGASTIGQWAEGSVVVILFAISEALEKFSMDKARQSIRSLMDIAPKEALVVRDGKEVSIHVEDILVGDIMLIKPGQKIAMDGVIVKGHSSVNQGAITGESVPVEKNVADDVFAGTLNEEGMLEVKVTKLVKDSTISKIIHLVEEAQGERAPAQAFVDKFAKYYTPAIMLISFLVVVIPPTLFNGDWNTWLYQGLSLLVVGCPCSLVISTPVSIVSAISNAAKNGVLIKGGIYLEEVGGLQAIAFDKTGTLTKGEPVVTDYIVVEDAKKDHYFEMIAALESYSGHPLASAIMKELKQKKLSVDHVKIEDFSSITGKGIKGKIEGVTYYVGSAKLFEVSLNQATDLKTTYEKLQAQGKTVMIFGEENQILGMIAVADEVRVTSQQVIKELHEAGIKHTIMLTGDNETTAQAIGQEVGVTEIKGDLMPQDKLDYIKSLKNSYQKVAMVGDGVNDAPALAAASVGIAMGGAGTDTALETADVALMGDDLEKLPFLIRLSRKTLGVIKQNITLSLAIKLIALLLIIPGWLTLWLAIVADMGATILVTLNGLRLMKIK
ncbi:heavy metal translocating P-type ATPase [Vagococcus hydrophili]|uniref:Cd(2+)-exporting ATPase n=1 Tax=Vagococcus hydrophili TaxID=2714947 RepID=A0A6G8ATQ0_9ENTE|nr:heavy metal translocating P-type ATPase [Vagococcus hydrophili]QIL48322.1 heavy metal translocating P-type ATPase [Vagococcus hydrophili]